MSGRYWLILALMCVTAFGAIAADRIEERFQSLDANGDNRVTPDELSRQRLFGRLDRDGDGSITRISHQLR